MSSTLPSARSERTKTVREREQNNEEKRGGGGGMTTPPPPHILLTQAHSLAPRALGKETIATQAIRFHHLRFALVYHTLRTSAEPPVLRTNKR